MDYQGDDINYSANAEKYPMLRRFVIWLKFYACGCFVIAAISLVYLNVMDESSMIEGITFFGSLMLSGGFVAQGFFFLMVSEVPQVFMDMEQNTRGMLTHLEDEARQRRAGEPKPPGAAVAARDADLATRVPKPSGP